MLSRKKEICLSFIFLFIAANPLFSGDFGDVYGAHPAANAMGNAVTATVNNSSAVYYNVAGLGRLSEGDRLGALADKRKWEKENGVTEEPKPKLTFRQNMTEFLKEARKDLFLNKPLDRPSKNVNEVTLQYNYADPRLNSSMLSISDTAPKFIGGYQAQNTNTPVSQDLSKLSDNYAGLGLTLNLNNIYDFKRIIRFGLNVLAPSTGNLLTINDVNPTAHRYLQYGVANQKPAIMGGTGVEIIKDKLFAGIGFTAIAGGGGAILLKDVPLSPDTVIPNQQVILQVKPIVNPTYGLAFTFGKFSGGISYRRETALAVNSLGARAQTTLLGIQLDFDVALYDLFSPRKWSYGLAYKPSDKWLFSVDMNRELWSQLGYKNKFLGTEFMSRTKAAYSEPFHLVDVTVLRAGTEYKWNDYLRIRGGIARRPKATPTIAGANNWIDFDRMIYTTGISLILFPGMKFLENLKNPVVLDAVAEYQDLTTIKIFKYSPTPKNPNYSTGGHVWHLGFSATMFF
jgi:hypothetical protein